MRFKKSKDEIRASMDAVVYSAVYREMDRYNYASVINAKDVIQAAINEGIRAAMYELFDSIYTDEEFERDIGLDT